MSGVTLPAGYSYQSLTTYANNETFRNSLKNNQDLVKISVVDSRGNISSIVKPYDIVVYEPPRIIELEAVRINDIETGVRLKATGKKYDLYDINYIKYTVSTEIWENGETGGTTYGPFDLDEVTYNDTNTEFYIDSLIQGDLGASGFTFGQKFYIKIKIADAWNALYPFIYYTDVKTGKILMDYADNGISFGGLYDEEEGGTLQLQGKKMDNLINVGSFIRLERNATQSITLDTLTAVVWQLENINTSTKLTKTGNSVVIGAGVSFVTVSSQLQFSATTGIQFIYIVKNGVTYRSFSMNAAQVININAIIDVVENDAIEIKCYSSVNATISSGNIAWNVFEVSILK